MKFARKAVSTVVVVTGCVLALPSEVSWALSEGRGAGGEPYAAGGVGDEERRMLLRRRQDFNVWVTTAATQSGAYLADVRINVMDAANRQVLSVTLDGPLLLIRLTPGRYTIEALLGQQKQQQAVIVAAAGQREVYFYFDVAAEALPQEPEARESAPRSKR